MSSKAIRTSTYYLQNFLFRSSQYSFFFFLRLRPLTLSLFFFFNDTATTEIYTLPLHDALPISRRLRRRHADAEERQRRLGDDDHTEHEGGQHDGGVHHVGQDVAPHDGALGAAGHDGQTHVVAILEREHLAAHHARVARPVDDAEDDDDVHLARPHDGGQEDREGQRRQRQPRVGHAHDDLVHPAPEVTGEDPQHRADHAREDDRGEADHHRDARAEDQAREHVAPDVVGAEQVRGAAALLPRRRPEALAEQAHLGIVGDDHVGEDGQERDHGQDGDGHHRPAFAAKGREAARKREDGGSTSAHNGSSDRSRRTGGPPRG